MTESLFSEHLEQLLKYTSPDARDAASRLMARCTSNTRLASTDFDEIASVVGERSARLIKLAYALAERKVTDSFKFGIRHSDEEIIEYFKAKFYTQSHETSFVMLFDEEDKVIGCEFIAEGTVNFISVPPRRVLEIAIKKKANSVIIAHNHPGGVAKPSCEDIDATRLIASLFETSGRRLRAHYIFAGNDHDVIIPSF